MVTGERQCVGNSLYSAVAALYETPFPGPLTRRAVSPALVAGGVIGLSTRGRSRLTTRANSEMTPARCRGFLWLGVWHCGGKGQQTTQSGQWHRGVE